MSSVSLAQSEDRHYGLRYDLTLDPAYQRADVSLALDERIKGNIWGLRFHIDPERHEGFAGDGKIERDGEYVTWTPPDEGGKLSFHLPVTHRRSNGRLDARITDEWALFRGDDLFPPASTDQHDDAEADATLHVHLPQRWSFVAAYPATEEDDVYEIEHEHRSFDRPTGWMAAGRLGVRRERIAGVRVAVVGPMGQGVRRMDILALLNWNLPEFRGIVSEMPQRLLIVSAGDPMWRGGLSGPNSLFLHSDRPLISENGTSTPVHELVHVTTSITGEPRADWIVEGTAEYYSLELMRRSGTITKSRYESALEKLAEWGEEAERLDASRSSGPITARAVGVFHKLDQEIQEATEGEHTLDDVMQKFADNRVKVSLERFREAAADVMGKPAEALSDAALGLAGEVDANGEAD